MRLPVSDQVIVVAGDAASDADAVTLCARAVERFGRIDTVVASVMVTSTRRSTASNSRSFSASWT